LAELEWEREVGGYLNQIGSLFNGWKSGEREAWLERLRDRWSADEIRIAVDRVASKWRFKEKPRLAEFLDLLPRIEGETADSPPICWWDEDGSFGGPWEIPYAARNPKQALKIATHIAEAADFDWEARDRLPIIQAERERQVKFIREVLGMPLPTPDTVSPA